MTALNDRDLIAISAESRALIRAAIRTAPGWRAYAEANDVDISTLTTRDAIFDTCDALQIDVAATIAAGPQEREEAPKERAPRAPRAEVRAAAMADFQAKIATVPAFAPPPVPADAAAQLLSLIAGLTPKAAIDMDAINAQIELHVGPLRDHQDAFDAVAQRLRDDIEALRQREPPAVRLEIAKGGEVRTVEGTHHPKFATLMRALSARQGDGYAPNIWISGPAGSGKTHAAKTAAKALGVAFHYNGALSMPHELLGFIDAAGRYHRTPFREAYEHGGVYLFDEVDGSDNSALLALNAALANGTATFPDGQYARNANCYVVATANTWGLGATAEYIGRSKIDAAFLSRFPVRIGWDYDEALERAISGNVTFADRVQGARRAARKAGLKVLIDPRASIAGAALVASGFTEIEAAELTYLANLTPDQRRMIVG